LGRPIDVVGGAGDFQADGVAPRVAQEVTGTLIAAQAPQCNEHGPGQDGRRTQRGADARRDDAPRRAAPGGLEQREIRRPDRGLVGEQYERAFGVRGQGGNAGLQGA
jgi:hypothetical protein